METAPAPLHVAAVVFPDFEILDLCGPLEMLWLPKDRFAISIVAEHRGEVRSAQDVKFVAERTLAETATADIILVPGGRGTRREVSNPKLLEWLRQIEPHTQYVTSVCTGSALLAKAGLLDGRRATSNKNAFDWVSAQGPNVSWVRAARWVEDGKFFTSSGVSAGMDMALGLIAKILGTPVSEQVARWAEYTWHRDSAADPFARAER